MMIPHENFAYFRDWFAYSVLCFCAVAFLILPLPNEAWAAFYLPEFLFLLALVWIFYNPATAHPVAIVVPTFFLDFALISAPGLWSLIIWLASGFLSLKRPALETSSLWEKMLWLALILGGGLLAHYLLRTIFALPHASLFYELKRFLILLFFAPLAYFLVWGLFSRPKLSERQS